MSSASTIGLPYENILVFNFETPVAGIQSGTNFQFTFLDNRTIPVGSYYASYYINITQEGGDTELGTVTTQLTNVNITNTFPVSSNYLGQTSFIAMEGVPLKIQNTQIITVLNPTNMNLLGNFIFDNTEPTATGNLILKSV
jgi:hypothetical protein